MQDLIKKRDGKAFPLSIGALILMVSACVVWAYLRVAEVDKKRAEPATANLGQAPATEAFNQNYQAKLEQLVTERMQRFQEQQAQQQKAATEQQRAAMDRIEAMAREAASRMTTPAPGPAQTPQGEPAAAAPALLKPTKVHTMKDATPAETGNTGTFLGSPADLTGTVGQEGNQPSGKGRASGPAAGALVIPEAGWAKGRLLNGVIGAQGGEFKYTSIKLAGEYHSANNYVQNLDGCIVTGEARAILWERRFDIKPIALTCTLPNGHNKTWKTAGWVVDARDGIQGVNATLVNNVDKKLVASMAAGALAQGGSYLSQRETTSTFAPGTGVAAGVVTGSAGKFIAGGLAQGAGKSLQGDVQEYYDLFRSTLQVGGGGEITVHLTSTLELPDGGEAVSTVKAAN